MGNCIGITATPPPPPLPIQEHHHENTQQDYGHHISNTALTTPTNTPYVGTPDQMGTGIGTGTETGSSSPAGKNNAVVPVTLLDPRLLSLLDFFRQLYARRGDIFKKIMPVHREAFEDIFKGIIDQENRKVSKRLVMQRSNSFGAVESVRPRRFKIKPIETGGAAPPDSGGGAGGVGGSSGGGGANEPAGGSK